MQVESGYAITLTIKNTGPQWSLINCPCLVRAFALGQANYRSQPGAPVVNFKLPLCVGNSIDKTKYSTYPDLSSCNLLILDGFVKLIFSNAMKTIIGAHTLGYQLIG